MVNVTWSAHKTPYIKKKIKKKQRQRTSNLCQKAERLSKNNSRNTSMNQSGPRIRTTSTTFSTSNAKALLLQPKKLILLQIYNPQLTSAPLLLLSRQRTAGAEIWLSENETRRSRGTLLRLQKLENPPPPKKTCNWEREGCLSLCKLTSSLPAVLSHPFKTHLEKRQVNTTIHTRPGPESKEQ